ncbi:hypothetical protein ABT324_28225 [Saccharopolyspora sp. NPDC000359]|uniref:hypothetical protein n=1 Tax=Saccharopolyspora sp. NPDC000359 TaxID=3154251 RepID=UPI00332C1602
MVSSEGQAPLLDAEVRHALRGIRPTTYRIEQHEAGLALSLTVPATLSLGGRRNVATRIVSHLQKAGIGFATDDPVQDLITLAACPLLRATQPG